MSLSGPSGIERAIEVSRGLTKISTARSVSVNLRRNKPTPTPNRMTAQHLSEPFGDLMGEYQGRRPRRARRGKTRCVLPFWASYSSRSSLQSTWSPLGRGRGRRTNGERMDPYCQTHREHAAVLWYRGQHAEPSARTRAGRLNFPP